MVLVPVAGCDKKMSGSREYRAINGRFNPNRFSPVPLNLVAFGNESRVDPNLRIDGMNNWDFSLAKRIPITQKVSLHFTAEFYNLCNRIRFSAPNNCANCGSQFGIVTAVAGPPRQIQFGLRLSF